MKRHRRLIGILVLGLAAAASFLILRRSGAPDQVLSQAGGTYYCPMHPSYTSPRPGDCPICNMKLVLREEPAEGHAHEPASAVKGSQPAAQSAEGYAAVLLSPQKQQLIGVRTGEAQKRRMVKVIRTVGRIAYDPELYQTEQEYLQALSALERARQGAVTPEMVQQAERLLEAARTRLRIQGLGEELIAEIEKAGEADKSLLLAGPSGRAWLYAPVYEFELPHLKIGQTIRVESPMIPGKSLEGKIRSVDPVLDPITRTARVRAVMTDPERILRPEMYVDALLEVDLGDLLAVPEEALFDTGTRRILFVDRGEGLFEPRDVTAGARAEGYVEIQEGVAEGERVVTSGNFLIDSESRLKGALEGMGEGEHRHGPTT